MDKVFSILSKILLSSILFYFSCCNSKNTSESSIATDTASIALGQASFVQNCSACHNFRQDGIGPQLGGITARVSPEWIREFIRDPKKVIESGDARAVELLKKYNTMMPSFAHYPESELNGIIAFLHTQKEPQQQASAANLKELSNPIPDSIMFSDLVVGVDLVTQIPPSGDKLPITRIAKLDFQPKTEALFVVDLRGKMYKLENKKPVVYLDMSKEKSRFINQPGLATGFGSFAFHPEFDKNGLLYTTHTEKPGSAKADFSYADSIPVTLQWVISEWKTGHPGAVPFSGKSRELFRINMVTGIHGVQEITFNPLVKPGDPDYGMLYIGVGDGGCVEEGFQFLAHTTERPWGTIFRIDPSAKTSANGQYGIPKDNPFSKSDNSKTVGEIYAYGFRNPHRITWTRSGLMLACNIGQKNIESENLILPGHDYGWPIREGTFLLDPMGDISKVYPLPPDDKIYNVTYPVAQYDHDEGLAITGGFEYWGEAIPEMKGKFFFGDINNGRLFYVELADIKLGSQATIREWKITMNGKPTSMPELCGNPRPDMRYGRDAKGELYLFGKTDGKVYKLVPSKGI